MKNLDPQTVDGFGDEWRRFDQTAATAQELDEVFAQYFRIFPWEAIPTEAEGFDLGCGSGRWAERVAPRVGLLHCIDASEVALDVARRNLQGTTNCRFHLASVDFVPLSPASMDFGYSLGVLHHVPDPPAGLAACARLLKRGAPFLLYLYYAFDQRPWWFRGLWKISDGLRQAISAMPYGLRSAASQSIALGVYFPLARAARLGERLGIPVEGWPLSFYRQRSLYTMRTDARDRFGTRLEKRFTAREIRQMMEEAGFERIEFSDSPPYWCAVGYKK